MLDAGLLVSIDRGEAQAREFVTLARRQNHRLQTTHPVVAQVWRDGARQARLAAFLKRLRIHPFDNGIAVGRLLAETDTSDVVDAHLVLTAARLGDAVLTGDTDDLSLLASPLGPVAPTVHAWP